MSSIGALEMLTPMVQPAEYWKESGRFEVMGRANANRIGMMTLRVTTNQKRYSLKWQNMN